MKAVCSGLCSSPRLQQDPSGFALLEISFPQGKAVLRKMRAYHHQVMRLPPQARQQLGQQAFIMRLLHN